jgi:hypothetical protein
VYRPDAWSASMYSGSLGFPAGIGTALSFT